MKVFIVLAHPEHQSFNGAMFRTAVDVLGAAGHEIKTSDLYALRFDPVSSRTNFLTVKDPDYYKQQTEELYASESYGFADEIEREIQNIEWCDLMIWQFPLWWFGLPGILKGWVDRVFAMGRTYGGDRIYANGVFRGKRAMLSLTTGGPAAAYEKGGFNGDLTAILRPIQRGILQFTGFDVLAPQIVYGPVRLSRPARTQLLEAYAARLQAVTSEQPIDVGSY
ncbi:NAD(P)H-dependent oxidoreductase [Bradyrhizobium ontarionense]|uniref:NAD(P)H-dependent oxidoreductase n=1 Tax=Bradyrhizobium ontarionense TaxID=2898149 RepID=A0ABY3RB21_9BRAD|nr:NAD(P)H-dependent oxidoreductase [Bradyrhizobium sp. A19]UFZ04262.1 NAD(P)H-dependent oxidoreductase [Bradyrhizobium sp. A19]